VNTRPGIAGTRIAAASVMNVNEATIVRALSERWWVPVLRGVAAILFGLALLAAPGIGLFVLVILWGAYALVDGIAALVMAARGARTGRHRGWLVVEGIVSVAAGLVALAWPGITAIALLMVIAAWAVVTGIAEIAASFAIGGGLRHGWPLALAGVLSIVFGGLLLAFPGSGALALLWTIGAYAIVFGGMLVAFGVRLRAARGEIERAVPSPTPGPSPVVGAPSPV
jgi:uncharacterized membrane protein HdeD (DUF308 family)